MRIALKSIFQNSQLLVISCTMLILKCQSRNLSWNKEEQILTVTVFKIHHDKIKIGQFHCCLFAVSFYLFSGTALYCIMIYSDNITIYQCHITEGRRHSYLNIHSDYVMIYIVSCYHWEKPRHSYFIYFRSGNIFIYHFLSQG